MGFAAVRQHSITSCSWLALSHGWSADDSRRKDWPWLPEPWRMCSIPGRLTGDLVRNDVKVKVKVKFIASITMEMTLLMSHVMPT